MIHLGIRTRLGRSAKASTTGRVQRSHLYWHLIFFGLVLALLFAALKGLGDVLAPVAAALILSYLLDPLVCWMQTRLRFSRLLGTVLLILVTLLLITAMFLLVVPVMVREIHSFAEAVPGYVVKIRNAVVPWIEGNFNVKVPGSLGEVADQFGTDLKEMATKTLAPLGGMAGRVALGAASFLNALAPLLLVPIFTFYFLPKFPSIVRGAEELIPRRYQPWMRETAREVNRALSAWIRGQITVMGALAVLYATGLSIVGIKMAVLIGAVTGLLAFIPYVGVVVGFSLAVLVCLLEYHGPGPLVGVAVVFGAMQAVEGLFLTPYLVGEKVGLGPVGVLLALMIGGKLFGFVGVLLAVPTAAALVVLIKRGLASYKGSRFYQEGTATEENGDPIAEKMQRERDS